MSYLGGKGRTGKLIADAILDKTRHFEPTELIEPFCGMLGVTRHLVDDFLITSSDNNDDLIYLHRHLKENPDTPMPEISRELFGELKKSSVPSFEKSFAMLFCSYLSVYRGSYVKNDGDRKYHTENYKSLKKNITPILNKFEFRYTDYQFWDDHLKQGGFVVYCDPPYKGTRQPYKTKGFDTEKFWTTMERWRDYGNYVFVSELECPIANEELLSITLSCYGGKRMVDKLFYVL